VLFAQSTEGVDVTVRAEVPFDGSPRELVPESLLATIRAVGGVQEAEGHVEGYAQVVGADGQGAARRLPAVAVGPRSLGVSWSDDPDRMPLVLMQGRAPQTSDEVVIDADTAGSHDLAVDDRVTILFRGPPGEFTVVGIAGAGSADNSAGGLADSLGGAAVSAFELSTAQRVLGMPGMFGRIDLDAAAGVAAAELRSRVEAALPAGYEVATGETLSDEISGQLRERFAFLRLLLMVFAGLSLFFGGFIIHNTFAILVAQRRRELALL
jgi:putative ABC transport system permease protein